MGGLVGEMTFEGDCSPFLGLLRLAEVIHIGKATSFGFGRIRVSTM